MNEEMILKARAAKSPEELLKTAHENGIDLTEESAKSYFELAHKSGELADEELINAAGGGCYRDGKYIVTDTAHACKEYKCRFCGGLGEDSGEDVRCRCDSYLICRKCEYIGEHYDNPELNTVGQYICNKHSH